MNRLSKFLLLGLLPGLCLISTDQVDARLLRRWRTGPAASTSRQNPPADPVPVAARAPRNPSPALPARAVSTKAKARAAKLHLPGEFERQSALLIACQQMLEDAPEVFVDIAAAVRNQVPLIALVGNADDHRDALALLKKHRNPASGIRFCEVAQDTMWIRDYGPCLVQQANGNHVILDADYSSRGRPLDDAVPLALASHLSLAAQPVPQCIDGGNLLHNGWGLAIASETLLFDDGDDEPNDEPHLAGLVKDFYGFDQLVLLEALDGEPTGHVDMFATFVSPTTVVVGQFEPSMDLENAQRMDRNAARLAGMKTPFGPLRVVRIPMPPGDGPTWRTYTNVVFANGVLLVPVYRDIDAVGRRVALETFTRQLPGWRVVPIHADALAAVGGGLHCVTMNLAGLSKLPRFPLPILARPVGDGFFALDQTIFKPWVR